MTAAAGSQNTWSTHARWERQELGRSPSPKTLVSGVFSRLVILCCTCLLRNPGTSESTFEARRQNVQVLRFYCVWDDRNSLQGDRRPYRLHFFLEVSRSLLGMVFYQEDNREV